MKDVQKRLFYQFQKQNLDILVDIFEDNNNMENNGTWDSAANFDHFKTLLQQSINPSVITYFLSILPIFLFHCQKD